MPKTVDLHVVGPNGVDIVLRATVKNEGCPQPDEVKQATVTLTFEQILTLLFVSPNGYSVREALNSLSQGDPVPFGQFTQDVFAPLLGFEGIVPETYVLGEPSTAC